MEYLAPQFWHEKNFLSLSAADSPLVVRIIVVAEVMSRGAVTPVEMMRDVAGATALTLACCW